MVSHLGEDKQSRIFKCNNFEPESLPLLCLEVDNQDLDFSNSSPFCLKDKLEADIRKPCQTLPCHCPYELSKRLRASAQKAVCDSVSFLSLSLNDGSFECQDASHLESPHTLLLSFRLGLHL